MKIGYGTAVVVVAASFVLLVYTSGGLLRQYADIPTLLYVIIAPFLYQLAVSGGSTVKLAFETVFNKDAGAKDLKTALLFFQPYAKTVWIFAVMAVLIGNIAMLKNLEDKSGLGPNLAVALFSLLYAAIIHLIIIPLTFSLKKRLIIVEEGIK